MANYQIGDRVCVVGRDGSRMANQRYPIWTGKIYEVSQLKNGAVVWAWIGTFGGTRSGSKPSQKFVNELREQAEYPWIDASLRHGELVG